MFKINKLESTLCNNCGYTTNNDSVCVCLQANHFDVIRLDIKVYHMPLHPQVEWQATPRTLDGTQTLGFLYSSKPKICRVSEGDHVLLGGNSYRMDLVKD